MMEKTKHAGPHTARPSLINKDAGGEVLDQPCSRNVGFY
jgi:hypothetical protein